MSIKSRIIEAIEAVLGSIDFEEKFEEALDDIEIIDIVADKVNDYIREVDFSEIVRSYIDVLIENELKDFDLDEYIVEEFDSLI